MQAGPRRAIKTDDPQRLLWLHQTISPTFSQGAPNPLDPTQHLPGEKVAKVAAEIKKKPAMVNNFPPLQIFDLTDPDTGETNTYSLSNRRLTAFKMSGQNQVKVQSAKFSQIFHSLWKMTSIDGGYSQPQQTTVASMKDSEPGKDTTLGKFKKQMSQLSFTYENYCRTNQIVGEEKDRFIKNKLKEQAKIRFNIG